VHTGVATHSRCARGQLLPRCCRPHPGPPRGPPTGGPAKTERPPAPPGGANQSIIMSPDDQDTLADPRT